MPTPPVHLLIRVPLPEPLAEGFAVGPVKVQPVDVSEMRPAIRARMRFEEENGPCALLRLEGGGEAGRLAVAELLASSLKGRFSPEPFEAWREFGHLPPKPQLLVTRAEAAMVQAQAAANVVRARLQAEANEKVRLEKLRARWK